MCCKQYTTTRKPPKQHFWNLMSSAWKIEPNLQYIQYVSHKINTRYIWQIETFVKCLFHWIVCILKLNLTQPLCQCILALSQTQHAIMSVWVTAREGNKHNCALSGALNTRGFKVMESAVRVLVTTLAFSTQPHTSRALSAHYPPICMYTHTHYTFHDGGSILIVLYRELMRTFFKSITFTWETVHICVCVYICSRAHSYTSVCLLPVPDILTGGE